MIVDLKKLATTAIAAAGSFSTGSCSPVSNAKGVRMDFLNLDGHNRTMIWTADPGAYKPANFNIAPNSNTTVYVRPDVSILSRFPLPSCAYGILFICWALALIR